MWRSKCQDKLTVKQIENLCGMLYPSSVALAAYLPSCSTFLSQKDCCLKGLQNWKKKSAGKCLAEGVLWQVAIAPEGRHCERHHEAWCQPKLMHDSWLVTAKFNLHRNLGQIYNETVVSHNPHGLPFPSCCQRASWEFHPCPITCSKSTHLAMQEFHGCKTMRGVISKASHVKQCVATFEFCCGCCCCHCRRWSQISQYCGWGWCWSSMSLHTFGLTDSLCGTLHESAEFVCVRKPFIAFHDIASKQLHITFLSKQSDWQAEQLHGHAFADSTHQVKQAHHYMQNLKHAWQSIRPIKATCSAIQITNGVLRLLDTHQLSLEVQEVLIQQDVEHNAVKDVHAKVDNVILFSLNTIARTSIALQ